MTGYSLLLAVLGQALALVGPEQATSLTAGLREIKRSFLSGQGLMALALDAVSLA